MLWVGFRNVFVKLPFDGNDFLMIFLCGYAWPPQTSPCLPGSSDFSFREPEP